MPLFWKDSNKGRAAFGESYGRQSAERSGKRQTGVFLYNMDFSLVIPCYNEADNVAQFLNVATTCLDAEDLDYELVFVDDGSADETISVLESAIETYRNAAEKEARPSQASFKIIELSRNFGKESALYAGLEHTTGQCVGFIDADLQQDPSVALKMYRMLQGNSDIDSVAAAPARRRESAFLRVCKETFYRVFNGVSNTKLLANVSDFRVFRRSVADTLLEMHEQYRFSKGLFSWAGFKTEVIEYEVKERFSGESRWTFKGLSSYAWNGVLSFSTCPLSFVSLLGALLFFGGIIGALYLIIAALALQQTYPLLVPVLDAVVFLAGIQLLSLGVVGEYSARSYIESKQRPVYVARKEIDYPSQTEARPSLSVLLGRNRSSAVHSSATQASEERIASLRVYSASSNGTCGPKAADSSAGEHTPDIHVVIGGKPTGKH
jgi:glycosyltransferase involved in cell wall biosynthesis